MKKMLMISVSALALSAGAAFAEDPIDPLEGFPTYPIASGVSVIGTPTKATGSESYISKIGDGNNIGTGSANTASGGVDQTANGSASLNYSEIYQGKAATTSPAAAGAIESNFATATVTQKATEGTNKSRILQLDGAEANATLADGNTATVAQVIASTGTNVSTIEQTGKSNWASVSQGSLGNPGSTTPTLDTAVANATSTISQNGYSLTAKVNQSSNGANSFIVQNGSGNGDSAYPAVQINQYGNASNSSSVTQEASSTSKVTIDQSGDVDVINTSGVWQYGTGAEASVIQDGADAGLNTSFIWQHAGGKAFIRQHAGSANENYSSVLQNDASTSYVTQTSTAGANWSSIEQGGLSYAQVTQTANAADNKSTIVQSVGVNTAVVTQH